MTARGSWRFKIDESSVKGNGWSFPVVGQFAILVGERPREPARQEPRPTELTHHLISPADAARRRRILAVVFLETRVAGSVKLAYHVLNCIL